MDKENRLDDVTDYALAKFLFLLDTKIEMNGFGRDTKIMLCLFLM